MAFKKQNLLIKFLITALSLSVAAFLIDGIYIESVLTLIIASCVLGLVNAFIKPFFILLTLPVTIITLGLFLFIINGVMLIIAAAVVPGFTIKSVWAAVMGWIIISFTGWITSKIFSEV